jgi:hypothetical protein
MSKEFMNLSEEYKEIYEANINQMLGTITSDYRFSDSIRNLCKQALDNNWDLSKKVNILNIVTQ